MKRVQGVIGRIMGKRRMLLAVSGVLGFALAFLPHLMTDPIAPYQAALAHELTVATKPQQRLIGALPREHAKTTLGTVALVLYELCLGNKRNILLVGANRREAEGKLRQIVHEIETNKLIPAHWRARLAPARDLKSHNVAYGDTEIVLTGGARITTLGFGGRVRGQLEQGRRLDLVILDDPEDDATVASPELRHKFCRWMDHALINALDVNHGSLVWLGTLLHHDSVLSRWMKRHGEIDNNTNWFVMKLAAIANDGQPLWPGRWNMDRLTLRRCEIGEQAFAQEYMNRPVSLGGQVFREGDFRSYDPSALTHDGSRWFIGLNPLNISIGVDPAIGLGTQHDYFAACVVGIAYRVSQDGVPLSNHPDVFVLETLRERLRFAEQLVALKQLAMRWQPRLVAIESVAYQAALSQAAWDSGLPVKAAAEQRPKAVRIEAAAVHVAQGRVYLPTGAAWTGAFRSEAYDYPAGRHDDQLDAFARSLEAALSVSIGGGMIECSTAKRGSDGLQGYSDTDEHWQKRF